MSWPSPPCDYQMNGTDICFGYTNLQGILDGKWTVRYKSISDILISHSVEVMVYQYDKLFGYGWWMTSILTITHIFIFLG